MDLNQINQEYGSAVQSATGHYYNALEEIRADKELTPGERAQKAWGAHTAAREALEQATALRNEALVGRQDALERKLFKVSAGVTNEAGYANYTRALEAVAQADDATLERLSRLAQKTRNSTLGKAAFVEAHERGLGALVDHYIMHAHDEDRGAYSELSQIPDEAARDRALLNVESAIPEPTTAQVTPSATIHDTPEPAPRPLAG